MFKNSTHAFWSGLRTIWETGATITVRSQETKEVRSHLCKIAAPLERVYVIPDRHNNIFAQIAESLWVMGGRNDLEFLSPYLPRAINFSDDGKVWRGAYGARLRNWKCFNSAQHPGFDSAQPTGFDSAQHSGFDSAQPTGIDQIKEVVNILNQDPHSRRAVMIIFDPAQDYINSKDIPCNNWLHFLIREGKLHLNVSLRSNDIWWGFSGINTYEWSVLQEMIAFWTGTQVGEYSHFASSFHLYDRHYQSAQKILANTPAQTLYDFGFTPPNFSTPLTEFDRIMEEWFAIENRMRQGKFDLTQAINNFPDNLLRNSLEMLEIYNRFSHGAAQEEIVRLIEDLPSNDFKVAAIEYFSRKFKNRQLIKLEEQEREFFQYFWSDTFSSKKVTWIDSINHNLVDRFTAIFAQLSILHYKKSLVYKDSWKKHGEVLGVFSNITRKYDRIETVFTEGVKATSDESLLDTIADLAVYATKYLTYLAEHYESIFQEFIEQYLPADSIENYYYNEGFDAVVKILIKRYKSTNKWEAISNYPDCFTTIKTHYKGLEDVLINGDWRKSDPRKCSLAADLAISAMHYLVLVSMIEPEDFKRIVSFIETL